jgi:hypothetical protein
MSENNGNPKNERAKLLLASGHELKAALKNWEELSKLPPEMSPDDKMLQDVQSLLKEIKSQLSEFDL